MLAPIILFVYNRPEHTIKTLIALKNNLLSEQSILYIYADGPKKDATLDHLTQIENVRSFIKSDKWCKEVIIIESETNKGLANSIIGGVTEIVNKYGKIIVLEDDIVTSRGFLKYMNDALDIYENKEKVMHISGYMYPHNIKNLSNTFFYALPSPWGWATWRRAWKHFNEDSEYLWNYFENKKSWDKFNTAGGIFFQDQLEKNRSGELKTWFVKWHACLLIQNGLTLFPHKSLTYNTGFDGSGEHCGPTTQFDGEVTEYINVKKQRIKSSKKAKKIIFEFYQGKSDNKIEIINNLFKDFFLTKPKQLIMRIGQRILFKFFPQLDSITELPRLIRIADSITQSHSFQNSRLNSKFGINVKYNEPYHINDSYIGDYTYIASNSIINRTTIGKFCSIGPNLVCGWGIHPTNGLSTSPMFYSTLEQNGITFSETDKIIETKQISIGNDVFIGMNVSILDGVTIGDGAVIGAGAVVSKDIPPYAIAVGSPIKIIKYRFENNQIEKLLKIKWWEFDNERLNDVEKMFFEVDKFIEMHENE